MKNLLLTAALFLGLGLAVTAQSDRFAKGMENGLTKLDSIKNQEDCLNASATFQRIAQAEKTRWEPFYYAAYCRILAAFMEQDKDKVDAILDPAEADINSALAINAKNSEVYTIQAMLYQARISVSFTRGMKYSGMANESIEKAIVMNPSNPRAYYIKGQNIFYTPSMFGGGAENAKPHFEKALAIFNAQSTTAKDFSPAWGKKKTIAMLKACEAKQ